MGIETSFRLFVEHFQDFNSVRRGDSTWLVVAKHRTIEHLHFEGMNPTSSHIASPALLWITLLLDNGAARRSLRYEQSCFTPLFWKSSYYSGFRFSLIVFRSCNLVHRNVGIWSGSARCHTRQNPYQFFVFTSLANDIAYHESHFALFCKTTWTPPNLIHFNWMVKISSNTQWKLGQFPS